MSISKNLLRFMEERGESNYRLAKDLGVSQSTIANWLNGRKPTGIALKAIAAHYGCTVEDLLKEGDA